MRIYVKVIPKSSQRKVKKISEGDFKVWVHSVPEKGKANLEVQKVLADYFGINKSAVEIIGGKTASKKIFEISF